jgi:hypothetical protein
MTGKFLLEILTYSKSLDSWPDCQSIKAKRELIILGIAIRVALLEGGNLVGRRNDLFHRY